MRFPCHAKVLSSREGRVWRIILLFSGIVETQGLIVAAAPSEAGAAIGSGRGVVSRAGGAGHGGSCRLDASAGQSRSTKVFSMRARTGLVST